MNLIWYVTSRFFFKRLIYFVYITRALHFFSSLFVNYYRYQSAQFLDQSTHLHRIKGIYILYQMYIFFCYYYIIDFFRFPFLFIYFGSLKEIKWVLCMTENKWESVRSQWNESENDPIDFLIPGQFKRIINIMIARIERQRTIIRQIVGRLSLGLKPFIRLYFCIFVS